MDLLSTCLFDVDGTFRPPPTVGQSPTPPPADLSRILRAIRKGGVKVGVATGETLNGMRAVERQMRFRMDLVAVSHGTRVVHRGVQRGPTEHWLVPKQERDAFRLGIIPRLDEIADRFGDVIVHDRSYAFTMFLPPESDSFREAARQVGILVGLNGIHVRFTANAHDGGITVLPLSGGKQPVINHLQGRGHTIKVAAGDTASDLPLAKAAGFFIATRTQKGSLPNPLLVQEIKRRGVGYVAKEDEIDGNGLISGLLAARQAKVVSF